MAPVEMTGAGQAFTSFLIKLAGTLPTPSPQPRHVDLQPNNTHFRLPRDDSDPNPSSASANVGAWIWVLVILGILVVGSLGTHSVRGCYKAGKRKASKARVLGSGRGRGRNRGLEPGGYLPQHHRQTSRQASFHVVGGGIDHQRKAEAEERECEEYMQILRAETAARMEQKKKERREQHGERL